MNNYKFTAKETTILLDALNEAHPLSLLLAPIPTETFKELYRDYGNLFRPIITEVDGKLIPITHIEHLSTAKELGEKEAMVLIVEGLTEVDIFKIANLGYFFHQKDYKNFAKAARYIQNFIQGNWKEDKVKEIEGDRARQKTAHILKCSDTQTQNVLSIADKFPEAFDKIAEGELGIKEALAITKRMTNDTQQPGKASITGVRKENLRNALGGGYNRNNAGCLYEGMRDEKNLPQYDGLKNKHRLRLINFDIENIGLVELSVGSDAVPTGILNGKPLIISYDCLDEIDFKGQEVGAIRYTFQDEDLNFSFALVINNPSKIKNI